MSSNPGNNGALPPPNNPVRTAYEGFVQNTPLVCRYFTTVLSWTYMVSFFVDVSHYASNIPYFTVNRLQLYRFILGPMICASIFNLALAYFSFVEHGKRLELSMGSAQFLHLLDCLGGLVNMAHILLMYIFWMATGDETWAFVPASGIWTILFPLITVECCQAPPHSQRTIFLWSVTTVYYPLILLGIISLLGGIQISNCLAVAVGYAYGYGHLDAIKITDAKAKQMEETIYAHYAQRNGWVPGHAAMGLEAWNDLGSRGGSASGFGLFSSPADARGGEGRANLVGSGGADAFPSGGGRTLGGGPTRRVAGIVDARAARLKVLEGKKDGSNNDGEEKV